MIFKINWIYNWIFKSNFKKISHQNQCKYFLKEINASNLKEYWNQLYFNSKVAVIFSTNCHEWF